jgi:quercetin dioxygenase-like cupin family protein
MTEPPSAVTVLGPGEGTQYEARGSVMTFKALATTGAGRFSLMERTLPAGGRTPPPHRHTATDEAYFVLDGEVTFELEGTDCTGGPGHWVFVPGGTAHTFGNRSSSPARLLVLHAPPLDAYFAELHRLWHGEGPPASEDERALMGRHGMTPA